MNDRTLIRAGADASLRDDFRALAEETAPDGSARYPERPVLEWLARFLAGEGGGPNRDAPLYELCHLACAVEAAGTARGRLALFFLEPGRATAGLYRGRLDRALANGGWRRPGFERTEDGVAIRYPDGAFTVRFGRMPFLAALYHFLAGMEAFAFFAELEETVAAMTARPPGLAAIKEATGRLAARLRQYRRRHMTRAREEGRFDAIFAFLKGRREGGVVRLGDVGDADILAFWLEQEAGSDFRAYRTVFEAFVRFVRAQEEAEHAERLAAAGPIGPARDEGEAEPADDEGLEGTAEWTSPLDLLDSGPVAAIKFLKKESERAPLEALMRHGPMACRFPLAFLRLESFAPIQAAITNDLQVGRGADWVKRRIGCADALPYADLVARFERLLALVRRLQKAAFYVLHRDSMETREEARGTIVALGAAPPGTLFEQARARLDDGGDGPGPAATERLAAEAAKAFRSFARKGFEEAALEDEGRVAGFRAGAVALVGIAARLESFLAAARRIPGLDPGTGDGRDLDQRFEADRRVIAGRFEVLYGVRT